MESNVLNKVIQIEDTNGNMIMAFEIDEKGNLQQMVNCEIADLDEDYVFGTDKELIRVQAET